MSEEKPKIIVDEDWKAQVEAEREAARRAKAEPQPAAAQEFEYPPASLALLISMFASEAMVALGHPHPVSGAQEINLGQGRHLIDLLQVLEDKTAGNRTVEETAMLTELLHQLRLAFVAVQQHVAKK